MKKVFACLFLLHIQIIKYKKRNYHRHFTEKKIIDRFYYPVGSGSLSSLSAKRAARNSL